MNSGLSAFALLFAIASSNYLYAGVSAFVVPLSKHTPTTTSRITSFSSSSSSSLPSLDDDDLRKEERNNADDAAAQESRRAVLGRAAGAFAATTLGVLSMPSLSVAASMDEMAPVPREAYKKLPSGVIIADLKPGKSEDGVVKKGSRVNLQWVRIVFVIISSIIYRWSIMSNDFLILQYRYVLSCLIYKFFLKRNNELN